MTRRLALTIFATLVLSLAACAGPPVDNRAGILRESEAPSPHNLEESVFLAVPHIRQERDLCVPTSAAMVMAFYGDPHDPREVKVLSRGRAYDPEAPFDDFTSTWWKDLTSGIAVIGYSWHEEIFPTGSTGFARGAERIKQSLRSGRPVMVDVALYGSHTFVIVGFDSATERFFFRDPNVETPGLRALGSEQLEAIWNGRSYGLNGRPALFTEPSAR